MKRLAILWLAIVAAGCGGDTVPGVPCPAIAAAGLDVGVANAQTGQLICDAMVTVSEGTYSERLAQLSCRYAGLFERPGTYAVRAEKPGFLDGTVSNIRITMGTGPCPHVQTVRVEVGLTPAP